MKIPILPLLLSLPAPLLAVTALAAEGTKPNVVIILADDMGFGDVSSNNPHARTRTPNIDKLSESGIRFTEAHSGGATCTPSRYGLLTGRYYFRSPMYRDNGAKLGGPGYLPPLIEPGRETIGSLMQKAGYTTACIGKWHLGMSWALKDPAKPRGLLGPGTRYTNTDFAHRTQDGPNSRGFDYSFIIPSSLSDPPFVFLRNGQVFDPEVVLIPDIYPTRQKDTVYEWDLKYVAEPGDVYWARGVIWKNGEISKSYRVEKCADTIVAEAVTFIEDQAKKNPAKPFMLYLPLPGPHTPWLPNEKFRGTSGMGAYGDYVAQMDHAVGQIRDTLAALGMADNTLLIFSSDNGAHWGEEDVQQQAHESNWGRRGQKADVWDGGHHVPMFITWPAEIREAATYAHSVCLNDIIATLADLTGQTIDDRYAEDSVSFHRVIAGDYRTPTRDSIIYESSGGLAIVKNGWKLIRVLGSGGFTLPNHLRAVPGGPKGQLYHVETDPLERTNVYLQESAKVAELSALLDLQLAQGFSRSRARD